MEEILQSMNIASRIHDNMWLLSIFINLVSSEVPTLEEYERAKEALKDVLPRGTDLPKAVRLG